MAKLEKTLHEDFDALLARIEQGILEGSVSASLEASSDFSEAGARCSVRVFERFSYAGGNRLSMSVTLFQSETAPSTSPPSPPAAVRRCSSRSTPGARRLFWTNSGNCCEPYII